MWGGAKSFVELVRQRSVLTQQLRDIDAHIADMGLQLPNDDFPTGVCPPCDCSSAPSIVSSSANLFPVLYDTIDPVLDSVRGEEHKFDAYDAEADHPVVLEALEALYFSTNGSNWSNTTNWLAANVSYCDWNGVVCDYYRNVLFLMFIANNLVGPLPPELCNITTLKTLQMSGNSIMGPFPNCSGQWPQLTVFRIEYNPTMRIDLAELDWVFVLPKVNSISLINCGLYGMLPPKIRSNLTGVYLYNNDLHGPVPDAYCDLQMFHVMFNRLSGTIPTCFFKVTSRVIWLSLAHNQLEGNLPDVPVLGLYELSNNRLNGTVPKTLLETAYLLDLHSNKFDGLPLLSGTSASFKWFCDLSDNPLHPEFFTTAALLKHLNTVEVRLDYTGIYGELHTCMMTLNTTIRFLSMSHNSLYGPMVDLSDMIMPPFLLDLSYNDLEGQIATSGAPLRINIVGNPKMNMDADIALGAIGIWNAWMGSAPTAYGEVSCYPIQSIDTPMVMVEVGRRYINASNCICSAGFVGVPRAEGGCIQCPYHGTCDPSTGNTIHWPRGYYPVFSNDSAIIGLLPCTNSANRDASDCNPHNTTYIYGTTSLVSENLCTNNSYARLCSRCVCESSSHCYIRSDNICVECKRDIVIFVLATFMIVAILVLLGLSVLIRHQWPGYYRKVMDGVKTVIPTESPFSDSGAGTFKVLLVYVQTTNALNWAWPNYYVAYGMKLLSLSNAQFVSLGLVCLWPELSYPANAQLAHMLLLPLLCISVMVLLALYKFCTWLACRNSRGADQHRYHSIADIPDGNGANGIQSVDTIAGINNNDVPLPVAEELRWRSGLWTIIYLLYIFYFGLTDTALRTFNCVQDPFDGHDYVQSIPWMHCSHDDGDWTRMVVQSIIMLVVYSGGIFVLFGVLLALYSRERFEPLLRSILSSLYLCYRTERYWYEMVVLARRLALAILISVVPLYAVYRPVLIITVLLVSIGLQFWFWPYNTRRDNIFELVALAVITATFAAQDPWLRENGFDSPTMLDTEAGSSSTAVLINMMAVINVSLMGVMTIFALSPVAVWLYHVLRFCLPHEDIVM